MTGPQPAPIGVFDSGYGGLSILKTFCARMPMQPFIYLGDHLHAPYGPRSEQELYDLTTQNIGWLFQQDCQLVVLACNTASSILRTIQHEWQQKLYPDHRVLGVVVPTIEMVTGVAWQFPAELRDDEPLVTVGVFATEATVQSKVYPLEIHKRAPHMHVVQQVCPDLTTLIEAGAPRDTIANAVRGYVQAFNAQLNGAIADYVLLGCTHYALIEDIFRDILPSATSIIHQPGCVTASLENYLDRHRQFRGNMDVPTTPSLFTTGDQKLVNTHGQPFLFDRATFKKVETDHPACHKSAMTAY